MNVQNMYMIMRLDNLTNILKGLNTIKIANVKAENPLHEDFILRLIIIIS